jgi:hypothetical protein
MKSLLRERLERIGELEDTNRWGRGGMLALVLRLPVPGPYWVVARRTSRSDYTNEGSLNSFGRPEKRFVIV